MLRKLVWGLIVVPLAVALLALALANRHDVRLVLDPLQPETPTLAVEAPLFLQLLAALIAGVAIGGTAAWLRQGKWRRAARRRARETDALRREADRLSRQLDALSQPRLPGQAAE